MNLVRETLLWIHLFYINIFPHASSCLLAPRIRKRFQLLCPLHTDYIVRRPVVILWIDTHTLHKATESRRDNVIRKHGRRRRGTGSLLCRALSPRTTLLVISISTAIVAIEIIITRHRLPYHSPTSAFFSLFQTRITPTATAAVTGMRPRLPVVFLAFRRSGDPSRLVFPSLGVRQQRSPHFCKQLSIGQQMLLVLP